MFKTWKDEEERKLSWAELGLEGVDAKTWDLCGKITLCKDCYIVVVLQSGYLWGE